MVAPAATISIDLAGTIFLDRKEVALSELAALVEERTTLDPTTVVYLAVAEELPREEEARRRRDPEWRMGRFLDRANSN